MREMPQWFADELPANLQRQQDEISLMSQFGDNGVVIVPQSGLSKSHVGQGGVKLSWDVRMRNLAALHFVQRLDLLFGTKPKAMILGGGAVYSGYPLLGELAEDYLLQKGLDPAIQRVVTNSRNTHEDLTMAFGLIEQHHFENGVVISNRYHETAKAMVCQTQWLKKFGGVPINLTFQSAEDLLLNRYFIAGRFDGMRVVGDIEESEMVKNLQKSQAFWSRVLMVPFGPYAYNFLANLSLKSRAVAEDYQPDYLYQMINHHPRPIKD